MNTIPPQEMVHIPEKILLDLIHWSRRYCDGRFSSVAGEFNRAYEIIRRDYPQLLEEEPSDRHICYDFPFARFGSTIIDRPFPNRYAMYDINSREEIIRKNLHAVLVGAAHWALLNRDTNEHALWNVADTAMEEVVEYAESKAREARLEGMRALAQVLKDEANAYRSYCEKNVTPLEIDATLARLLEEKPKGEEKEGPTLFPRNKPHIRREPYPDNLEL